MGGSVALAVGLLGFELTDVEPQLIGQVVATIGFLLLLWRFDWLESAGITRLGTRRLWLIILLILLYSGVIALYSFFSTLKVHIALSSDMIPDLTHTTMAGVMEEILFRGVILYALVSRWGSSRRGIVSAVLVSAFLFGSLHFFNLATGEFGITAVQVSEAFLSAILYGALVLVGGSIWPAIALHSLINLLVNMVALSMPDFTISLSNFLTFTLLEMPLVIYGLYLLSKVELWPVSPSDEEAFRPLLAKY
jgi:membrane protease YdiL (CAAX protease family)